MTRAHKIPRQRRALARKPRRIHGGVLAALALTAVATLATCAPALAAPPEAPELSVEDATNAVPTPSVEARLRAVLNPNGEPGEAGTYEFLYKASSTGQCEGGSHAPASPGMSFGFNREEYSEVIAGLTPGTEYAVCVRVEGGTSKEATITTPAVSFTTALPPETPQTTAANPVAATTATLNGVLNPGNARTREPGTYEFRYKESANECEGENGKSVSATKPPGLNANEPVQAPVTGLLPNTQYTFCLLAINEAGEVSPPSGPKTFTTEAIPPNVTAEYPSELEATTATLNASIDPGGAATTYHFEYLTAAQFEADGNTFGAGVQKTPESASVGADNSEHPVAVSLEKLQPGTAYRFRAVATNAKSPAGTPGPVAAFATNAPPGATASLASLPDGRAYEMVSPQEKNGGSIRGIHGISSGGVVMAAANGERITYASLASFGDAKGAAVGSQYLSTRHPSTGWLTQNISTPMNDQAYVLGTTGTPFEAFSPELSTGLVSGGQRGGVSHEDRPVESPPLAPGAPPGYENDYLDEFPEDVLQPLLTQTPSVPASAFGLQFLGTTPDLSHIVVESANTALSPNAVEGHGFNLYEWNRETGGFQVLNVLPGDTASTPQETRLNLGGSHLDTDRAISEDGSKVIWRSNTGLYVRTGIETNDERTVQVDAPAGGGQFLTASSDDTKIFFDDANHLTPESSSEGEDMYMFEPETDHLADLTVDRVDPGGAEVVGVLGASVDGSYVYFVANGVLATGASPGNCKHGPSPSESTCNLYLWHEGWKTPKFIARLAGHDESAETYNQLGLAYDWSSGVGTRTARVSRDGLSAVFMSERSLTGYDNTVRGGSHCGEPALELPASCEEVFSYEASPSEAVPGHLICVSCNPSGTRPRGPSGIPGGTDYSLQVATYQSRVLSEGVDAGRVFFESEDALVPQDTNNAPDVYEYEEGQDYLISGGENPEGASFVDASETGNDVFFLTSAQLVPQDADRLVDLYDARAPHEPGEPAGFSSQPSAPCEGEECRPTTPPVPEFSAPASETFSGAGNLAPVTPALSVPVKAKPLTRAAKLAKALHTCKKDKSKKTRSSCEKQARKRYGAKKATKSSVKRSKK
jgi:hypothetical protein